MLIGALSKASGFSKDTIRYYEKIGLLVLPKHARKANNYKDYPPEALKTLQVIRNLKNLGFTLEEIREIIVRKEIGALDGSATFKIIEQKLIHLNIQIDKLLLYKHRLQQAQMQLESEATNRIIPLTEISMRAA
jgi:MerR family transcriptional regulator, copper efflux regulator